MPNVHPIKHANGHVNRASHFPEFFNRIDGPHVNETMGKEVSLIRRMDQNGGSRMQNACDGYLVFREAIHCIIIRMIHGGRFCGVSFSPRT